MDPVWEVSFRFEPYSRETFDPLSGPKQGRLNLVLWRRDRNGRLYESEVHRVGEDAFHVEEFDRIVGELGKSLRAAHDEGREFLRDGRRGFF